MTGFLKGKAVSQVDSILIDGVVYMEKDIKEVIKNIKIEVKKKRK